MARVNDIRTTIPRPRGLTNRNKIIFEDSGGNKLYAKKGSMPGKVQYSAHNNQGRLVDEIGVRTLMKRWNRDRK